MSSAPDIGAATGVRPLTLTEALIPVATREAALVIGADELALRVSLGGGAR